MCDQGKLAVLSILHLVDRVRLTFTFGIVVHSWLTLGNQLGGDQIFEEDLATRIRTR